MNVPQRRLTAQMLALVLLPTVVCLGGYGVVSYGLRRAELHAEAQRELVDYVVAIRAVLDASSAHGDRAELARLGQALSAPQRVHGVALFDDRCAPLAASSSFASGGDVRGVACAAARSGAPAERHVVSDGRRYLVRGEPLRDAGAGVVVAAYDLGPVDAMLRAATGRLACAGVLLAALLAAVAVVVARAFGRSLGELVRGAEEVAAGGLDVRIEETAFLGVERAARGFNEMTRALAASKAEVERAAGKRRELEARIAHTQTLAAVGQLAASLAHEIGTPLTTILMSARTASRDESAPPAMREATERIANETARISKMVRQMLDVARPAPEEPAQVDLREVVADAAAFLAPEGRARRVSITTEVGEDVPPVLAVRDKLLQLLVNLGVNALQAQPHGGRLVLRVARGPSDARGAETVELEVRDAGPGVPPPLRAKIFEPFFSTKRSGEGTGLGLSIAADVVRALDGTIALRDAPEGGAAFHVVLPATTA